MHLSTTTSTPVLREADASSRYGAFGLFCLAAAILHLGLNRAGIIGLPWLGLVLFHGGLGLIVAGLAEWRRQHTFFAVLYGALGLFCLSLLALIVLPEAGIGRPPGSPAVAAYLGMWSLFPAILSTGVPPRSANALRIALSLLALFLLLTAAAALAQSPGLAACSAGTALGFTGLAVGTGVSQLIACRAGASSRR